MHAGRVLDLSAGLKGDAAAIVDVKLAHTRCCFVASPQSAVGHCEVANG